MKRYALRLLSGAALALLAFSTPANADDPVIEQILFLVEDLDTKQVIQEVPANGDMNLEVGARVRIRAVAVPVGQNRGRRYPSASFELGNPSGLVTMSNMNSEMGATQLEVHRAFNSNKPDAVPFLRYKILEHLKIGPKMLSGNIYIRLSQKSDPVVTPQPSPVPQRPEDRRGITLYEHQDFRGRNGKFFEDDPRLNDNYFRHDIASSVRVDPGCKVTLWEHTDFQGRATVLTEDVTDLNGSRVGNDSVSSLQVDCSQARRFGGRDNASNRNHQDEGYRDRRGITLFEHPDFDGRSETFYADDSNFTDNFIRHDAASSVRVDPGCRAVLYEHPDFDGRASVITEDLVYLGSSRVGNDTVSSVEVRCDGAQFSSNRQGRSDRGTRSASYRREGRGITLFEHQGFDGRQEFFSDDDERLNDNEIRQDSVSSVRVDPGCEAVLYEHPDFQGRATVVTSDVTDLNGSRVGNDSVSSIEVLCRPGRT